MGINTALAARFSSLSSSASHMLDSLAHARHFQSPYDYWLLASILPSDMIEAIVDLPFDPPVAPLFDGRRESNNSTRIYFTPENQDKFPVCREVVDLFSDPAVISAMESMTGTLFSKGLLRIEYCQDRDGFWLEPHLDISVKYFTMLVYLSGEPELYDAGTDIYDATHEHNRVATAPYEKNKGLIFIPGKTTWHGFSKRTIKGIRKSLIINFVSPEWRSAEELAYR